MKCREKSFAEKLNETRGLPKVVKLSTRLAKRWKAKIDDRLLVPSPLEVDGIMKKDPKEKLITINIIRESLSKRHKTDICCPIVTGISVVISARASEEERAEGRTGKLTPYWRTLRSNGELNPKYPGGVAAHKKLLEDEGHEVIRKGRRYFVSEFEKYLINE